VTLLVASRCKASTIPLQHGVDGFVWELNAVVEHRKVFTVHC